MQLTPQMKFIQEKCILAAHPGLSLEEARQKEQWLFGCLYGRYSSEYSEELTIGKYVCTKVPDEYTIYPILLVNGKQIKGDGDYDYRIIGLPPTLPRILRVLNHCEYSNRYHTIYHNDKVCDRIPANIDGSDVTLFDQSPETINAIAREMGYKSDS